jgi:hypothetical protein
VQTKMMSLEDLRKSLEVSDEMCSEGCYVQE